MTISAIIIEDEQPARVTLKSYLEYYAPEVHVKEEFDAVKPAIAYLKENKEETIVFLDIELRDGKGTEIVDQIDSSQLRIIYTTAYNDYALHAFKSLAFGYLLKPIDPIDFKTVVKRAVNDIVLRRQKTKDKLRVPVSGGYEWIDVKSIVRCEAQVNYVKIVYDVPSRSVVIAKTLKQLEKELESHQCFIRIHQSHLINALQILNQRIQNNSLVLKNDEVVPVSRSRKKDVEAWFETF